MSHEKRAPVRLSREMRDALHTLEAAILRQEDRARHTARVAELPKKSGPMLRVVRRSLKRSA